MLALPDRDCAIFVNGEWVAVSCDIETAIEQQITESPMSNVQDNFFMVSHGRGSLDPSQKETKS